MDTKFLFVIGVMILILSTCSFDAAPAESGIDGQVMIVPVCSVSREGGECPVGPHEAVLTVNSQNGGKIVQVQTDTQGQFKIPLVPDK